MKIKETLFNLAVVLCIFLGVGVCAGALMLLIAILQRLS